MDRISKQRRSENMRRIRAKDTRPEMRVRRLVYALGYRYRLHGGKLPGRPDLIFKGRKKVIFVHGCFWHQHDDPACKIARLPKSNRDYWLAKLARNHERDLDVQARLHDMGWSFLILWECRIKSGEGLAATVESFLGPLKMP